MRLRFLFIPLAVPVFISIAFQPLLLRGVEPSFLLKGIQGTIELHSGAHQTAMFVSKETYLKNNSRVRIHRHSRTQLEVKVKSGASGLIWLSSFSKFFISKKGQLELEFGHARVLSMSGNLELQLPIGRVSFQPRSECFIDMSTDRAAFNSIVRSGLRSPASKVNALDSSVQFLQVSCVNGRAEFLDQTSLRLGKGDLVQFQEGAGAEVPEQVGVAEIRAIHRMLGI